MRNRMRSYVARGILALACLALISMPASAQTGATVAILPPTLSTYTASPGMNVGVFSRVTNFSSRKKSYTVVISSVSSCGEETVVASNRISFKGGETKLLSVSYPIAPGTCPGQMAVSVSASEGGVELASESTSLLIQ